MRKVERSLVANGLIDTRVIPNGVDINVFKPGDRSAARHRFDLPQDAWILLVAGDPSATNEFRDWAMFAAALAPVREDADRAGRRLVVAALGAAGPATAILGVEVRRLGALESRHDVADAYRAADIFAHPARVDTFPSVILEALATGTPVVATRVGGIPEQVRDIADGSTRSTGILAAPGDDADFASAVTTLLRDDELRERLAVNSLADAHARFDLDRQTAAYLDWYQEHVDVHRAAVTT
jgi:glycosyltransferase involved in cell wall biosynthesis